MDVIFSVVCGIDAHVFEEKDLSLFERQGQKFQISFNGIGAMKMFCIRIMPEIITKYFGISLMNSEAQEFLANAIKHSMEDRQKKGLKGDDFLQLMLEAKEGKLKLEDEELEAFEKDAQIQDSSQLSTEEIMDETTIIANCLSFIMAGFEGITSVLQFVTYELALNQDIQDKLREEINRVIEANNGKFSYEAMGQILYLDMIIQETLRRWTPGFFTDRICVKDYKIPGTDFVLEKGEAVYIPIKAFHADPDIFPNPEKFDPQRFSPENKPNINQYNYIPFGQGPRNCIGMRFALSEVKVGISNIVRQFIIQPSQKTMIPMKTICTAAQKPKGNLYLSLRKIEL